MSQPTVSIEANVQGSEEFKASQRLVTVTCMKGHTWTTRPSMVYLGGGCPTCLAARAAPAGANTVISR